MTSVQIAFWAFLGLTVLFALALLYRLLPRPAPSKPDLAMHAMALKSLAPTGVDADSFKAVSDAIAAILKALGEFGTTLNALGPTALLGVFTIVFSLLTVACAWLAHLGA